MSESFDILELRRCLGRFARGVTVVTCWLMDGIQGATVTAFTSVSLDPPLVLISLNRRSKLCAKLRGRHFAVNVLGEHAGEQALHFAGVPQEDVSVTWANEGVAPRLADAAAFFVCAPWRRYDGGDHELFLGRVERFGFSESKPLVLHDGSFCSVADPEGLPSGLSLDGPSPTDSMPIPLRQ
jgi:flavin reductase (DIM6/NTAB) family NADH-FMN oxidoreductase RutF